MSATLKDLAPAEKQKVARLIQQVVEKERELKALVTATAEQHGGDASKAQRLAAQNMELARENTSLRAKLSHAFDLLRTYQHKCRVLDATVQLTGSRPASPSCQPLTDRQAASAGPGVDAQLLASRLRTLSSSQDRHTPDGPSSCLSSGQLSPVPECAWEGRSPDKGQAAVWQAVQDSMPQHLGLLCPGAQLPLAPAKKQAQCASALRDAAQPMQQPLAQLETLKVLAQALLEAQAEVAAKQQQRQRAATAAVPPCADAAPVAVPSADAGGSLVYDASLGEHGGYLIHRPPHCSSGSSSSKADTAAIKAAVNELEMITRPPLVVQHYAAVSCSPGCASSAPQHDSGASTGYCSDSSAIPANSAGRCSSRTFAFDDDLLSLVANLENMGSLQHGSLNLHNLPAAGSSWQQPLPAVVMDAALYQENDLLDLIYDMRL